MSSKLKFTKGDQVRIIDKQCGHEFEIGQVVTIEAIYETDDPHYEAGDGSGVTWFVGDDEIAAVETVKEAA